LKSRAGGAGQKAYRRALKNVLDKLAKMVGDACTH
jgi:hypothetical protein